MTVPNLTIRLTSSALSSKLNVVADILSDYARIESMGVSPYFYISVRFQPILRLIVSGIQTVAEMAIARY